MCAKGGTANQLAGAGPDPFAHPQHYTRTPACFKCPATPPPSLLRWWLCAHRAEDESCARQNRRSVSQPLGPANRRAAWHQGTPQQRVTHRQPGAAATETTWPAALGQRRRHSSETTSASTETWSPGRGVDVVKQHRPCEPLQNNIGLGRQGAA